MTKERRTLVVVCAAWLAVAAPCGCRGENGELAPDKSRTHYREAAAAGRFYPADAETLAKSVRGYIEAAGESTPDRKVLAVIAPHAGYEYSGATAGKVFACVRGRSFKRVVVLAASHVGGPASVWVDDADSYRMPFGDVEVDREAVERLAAAGMARAAGRTLKEHSLEVELPFLHEALRPGWKLVPVMVSAVRPSEAATAARQVRNILDDETLVCVSSDFTHYGRAYEYVPFTGTDETLRERLAQLDGGAIEKITAKDAGGFEEYVQATGATICGRGAVSVALRVLPEWAQGEQVAYTTSGEITGDWSLSVSYAGIVFCSDERDKDFWGTQGQGEKTMAGASSLTDAEKKTLLDIARASLVAAVEKDEGVDEASFDLTATLKENRGAFVTLTVGGRLRGCIGYVEAIKPLWQSVAENAANAALSDPRFSPVTKKELGAISIEISAMSPLEKITDPSVIEVGKHGIMLTRGVYRGLLLPQVATEYGWTREEFLQQTCRKAGMPSDLWKDDKTTIEIFTAEVFGEGE